MASVCCNRDADAPRVPAPPSHRYFANCSHAVVVGAAAAFGRDPGDDLVGVRDVAGFAVDAVGRVQADALAIGLTWVIEHFVNVGGTEILAGAAEFFHASR